MYFPIFSFVFLLAIVNQSIATRWNYGDQGPNVWGKKYPLCNGRSQSPIDIKTACTVYRSFEPFQFSSAYYQVQGFYLTNNRHTIKGTPINKNLSRMTLTGGGLLGTYQFSDFHYHWGENSKSGSEHQVNNEKYSGELHLVYTNPTSKQIAVLGIFLQTNKDVDDTLVRKRKRALTSNALDWQTFFASADDLKRTNQSLEANLNLASMINIDLKQFWRYTGSLTTPPCTEGLT